MAQALSSDQTDSLHQRFGGIAQEDPINRIVDVGLDAGRVQEANLQVQWGAQAQFFGMAMGLLIELVDQRANRGFIGPLRIALESALGGYLDAIQFAQSAEVLQERAIGQTDGETPKVFHDQSARDVTPQGAAGMDLNLALGFGGDVLEWATGLPVFETRRDELFLNAALNQELIDTQELIAQTPVIDIAFDSGQRRLEGLLNGNQASRHELAYKLAH
ncbi:MAG: hypothetical protein DME62_15845 [Verrucomicrobia bacterium]|nr:MAG: hypothetical protein DME62_15845 [Verrucomicrobiota bacterium]